MTQDGLAPNPLGQQDAAALIGMMAVLEGHLVSGDLDTDVLGHLNSRLQSDGLVGPGAGPAELRVALSNLNQRLRYVLGEHEEPPQDTGAVDVHVGFAAVTDAQAFAEAVRAQGRSAAAPTAVDGRAYDDETVGWEVAVRSTALPLSAAFDREQRQLLSLAAEHRGSGGGWGSPPP